VSAETVTVRKDDLRLLMEHATALNAAERATLNGALARCKAALNAGAKDGTEESEAPMYPPGEFARVELPGYVAWTGWVAEETFAGAGVLVVRDISGTVQARVSAGAFRQVIPLALPKPGDYDGQLELDAGDEEPDWADDEGGEAY
jgi:hypothetical protein